MWLESLIVRRRGAFRPCLTYCVRIVEKRFHPRFDLRGQLLRFDVSQKLQRTVQAVAKRAAARDSGTSADGVFPHRLGRELPPCATDRRLGHPELMRDPSRRLGPIDVGVFVVPVIEMPDSAGWRLSGVHGVISVHLGAGVPGR
jgi:hypothetical protein